MAKTVADSRRGRGRVWRLVGWGTAALLLLLPAAAGAPWTASDFVFAAALLGGTGLAVELAVRKARSLTYRLAAAVALMAAFLTVWANGAEGMIGSEDNPLNLAFAGVLLVGLIGAILARFEPAGMMRAMLATAFAQAVAGSLGLSIDPRGAAFSISFAGLWLLAAALFHAAPSEQTFPPRREDQGPPR